MGDLRQATSVFSTEKEDNNNKLHFVRILYAIKFARIEFKNAAVRQADLDSNGCVILHKPLYLSGPQAPDL